MKTVTLLAVASTVLIPATLFADGKGNQDWAEKAVRAYEEKARVAAKAGKPHAAAIYKRMAEIKREAGRTSRVRKDFNWKEYHALEGKLAALCAQEKKGLSKNTGHGYSDLLRAAEEYRKKAHQARENGDTDKANIYSHLADHKVAAANAEKEGSSYDWTDYKALQKKLFCVDRGKPKRFTPVRLNIE